MDAILSRGDSADPDDSELEGQVDSFVVDTSITILGIAYGVNGGTQYEDSNGNSMSSAAFFAALANGDQVEIVTSREGWSDQIIAGVSSSDRPKARRAVDQGQ